MREGDQSDHLQTPQVSHDMLPNAQEGHKKQLMENFVCKSAIRSDQFHSQSN